MFKNTIVRKPSKTICKGITSSPELGQPNYELALKQHLSYINALKSCGVNVIELEALDEFPDSCFVEDTAVLTKKCAIISNPGAQSR
ncbi:MAG: N(G),N(G)-dimethylarginine dimethylaminohydrolase, partial [Cetobacterium sp.]